MMWRLWNYPTALPLSPQQTMRCFKAARKASTAGPALDSFHKGLAAENGSAVGPAALEFNIAGKCDIVFPGIFQGVR